MPGAASAAEAWASWLAEWAIPPEILAAAPESPWVPPPALFAPPAPPEEQSPSPSRERALEALPQVGSVLDVGCGAGAASLALVPRAGSITGVDESEEMLAAFRAEASARGVPHRAVRGRWPDVAAADVSPAEVVVCHHVLYNVPGLVPFAAALTGHARRRVVIEITTEHPRAWQNRLWNLFHGIDRPERPTAEDALAVFREMGLAPHTERWRTQARLPEDLGELASFVRRGLCLSAEREPEVLDALRESPPPATRTLVTVWWPGAAS